jgi:hypothetical protein
MMAPTPRFGGVCFLAKCPWTQEGIAATSGKWP